jgi:hypothetical protein
LHVRSIRRGEVIRTAAVLRLGAAGTVLLVGPLHPPELPTLTNISRPLWHKIGKLEKIFSLCKDYVSHNLELKLTLENISLKESKVQPFFRKIKTLFSCVAEFSAGKQHCLCHAHAVAAAAIVKGLARAAGEVGTFGHRVLILQNSTCISVADP